MSEIKTFMKKPKDLYEKTKERKPRSSKDVGRLRGREHSLGLAESAWLGHVSHFPDEKIEVQRCYTYPGLGARPVISRTTLGTSWSIFACRAPAHSSKPLKSLKIICIMNKMYRPLSRQACYWASVYSHGQMGMREPILSDGTLDEKAQCTWVAPLLQGAAARQFVGCYTGRAWHGSALAVFCSG